MITIPAKKKYRRPGIFGFYNRKIIFFVGLALVAYTSYACIKTNYYKADEVPLVNPRSTPNQEIAVSITETGKINISGQESDQRISFMSDFDELRLPVIDEPGVEYDEVTVTLSLPGEFAPRVKHQIIVQHGVGESKSYIKDTRTIIYSAKQVSSYATISIVAQIPKGLVEGDLTSQVGTAVSSIQVNVWLALGIALPSITFIFVLLFLLFESRQQRIDIPDQEITAPPMAIPPALVGVLFHQKVRPREIAATLIDLAIRGDIVIVDRQRSFAFGKKKFDQRLLGYEKILLTKIFRESLSVNRAEIERRINNHFYSRKISVVSAGIYALATRLGYFKVNPQRVHAKYRLIGIAIFLIGLVGFCLNIFLYTDPPFIVFFWIGMMLSALIIAFGASGIPIRTPLGQEALTNWMAFKKFLSNPQPIAYTHNMNVIFESYLPYAMVMDCEAAWAKRFARHNFILPTWFLTEKNGLGLEDFCLSLFPIISYVSRSLTALREPGFE